MGCQASAGGQPGQRLTGSKAQGRCKQPVPAGSCPTGLMTFLPPITSTLSSSIRHRGCPRERDCREELKRYQSGAKCYRHVKRWQQLVRRADCLNRTHSAKYRNKTSTLRMEEVVEVAAILLTATCALQWVHCPGGTCQHGHTI